VALLPASADWRAESADAEGWYTGFAGADDIELRHYRASAGEDPVAVLAIHYRRETQGKELVSSLNRLNPEGWSWLGAGRQYVESANGGREMRELRLRQGARHRLIWFWYDIGGWQTTSPALAKGFAVLNRLTGRPGDATLVAVASEHTLQADEARERLAVFVADHPQLLAPRGLIGGQ